jgi:sodium/proline symporter
MIGLEATGGADAVSLTGAQGGAVGFAFVAGTLGIGLGYPGHPHVLNRDMAVRDEKALRRGRIIAMTWVVFVIGGMLLLGLAARLMYSTIADPEQVIFVVGERMLGPAVSGLVIAAVLSAIMSTADSQLLVAASSAAHDWDPQGQGRRLPRARAMLVIATVLAAALAIFAPASIFDRVLFAWHALGAAFAPLVVLRITGYRVDATHALASMIAGAGLTVVLHWLPDTPGDFAERLIPPVTAFMLAWRGRWRS